jgi:mutator protein MutT
MTQIPVIAAIIRMENKVLLGRRPEHKRHGGLWEFPGGKIDEGESEVDAVTRELLEEFGVETISVGKVVYECRDPGSPFLVRFLDVGIRGTPEPTEHTKITWFDPESLPTVRLAPCDARFVVEYLLRVPAQRRATRNQLQDFR